MEALESLIDSVAIHKAKEEYPGAEADMFTELELLMAGVSVSKGEEQVCKGEEEDVKEMEGTSILSLPTLTLGGGNGDDPNGTTVPDQIPTSESKAVSPEMMEKPGQIPTSESKAVSPDIWKSQVRSPLPSTKL